MIQTHRDTYFSEKGPAWQGLLKFWLYIHVILFLSTGLRRIAATTGLIFLMLVSVAQSGGDNTYDFLNLTNSARAASLGGKLITVYDNDLNLPFHNPALLNEEMSNHLVLNYVNYFAGLNYGYFSYANSIGEAGNFAAGIHYLNYGTFTAADPIGEITGEFTAAEYAFNLIYSRKVDSLISFGVNLKPVYSSLESYSSLGIALDAGITYFNPDRLFSASLVMKNFGTQLTTYYKNGDREPLPFEILAGFSRELQHAPFRFSFVAQHLEKWDLTYKTEEDIHDEIDPFTGQVEKPAKLDQFFDRLMRHVIVGVEFFPVESFMIRLGYNYKRRQEMKLDTRTAMVGFSWGFGIRVSKFHISYGRAAYHLSGASNHFSLSTNLSEFGKMF